ncbi:MAG: hypothetical protein JWQ74_1262 [Marmoricola sp.]|nr:hypothetical protein [Marmoricola sp.]
MPGSVVLRAGKSRKVASKPESSASKQLVVNLPVAAGTTYRVAAARSLYRGTVYAPVTSRATAKVKRGSTTTVTVTWRKVTPAAQIEATDVAESSVRLTWRNTAKGSSVRLRRAVGARPPTLPTTGTSVYAGAGKTVVDRGLAARKTYSYSLFVKAPGKSWSKAVPIAVTTGGTAPDGQPSATYALAPGAVSAAGSDEVSLRSGQVWVTYAPWRPAPVVGAGVTLPRSAVLPDGFLGQVAEIGADGRSARLVPGSLVTMFDSFDLSADVPSTDVDLTPSSEEPNVTARSGAASGGSTPSQERCKLGASLKLEGPRVTFRGRAEVHVDKKWGIPVAITSSLSVSPGLHIGIGGEAGVSANCTIALSEVGIPVPLGPVPAKVTFKPEIKLSAAFTAHASLSADASITIGADFRLGLDPHFHPIFSKSLTTKRDLGGFSGKATLSLGGELGFGPNVSGPSSAGVKAGLYGDLFAIELSLSQDSANPGCRELALGGNAALGLEAKAWAGPLSASARYKIVDASWTYGSPLHFPTGCDTGCPTSVNARSAAGGVDFGTQQNSTVGSVRFDGVNNTIRLLGTGPAAAARMLFEVSFDGGATYTDIATVAPIPGLVGTKVFSTEWTPPTSLYNTNVVVRSRAVSSVDTPIGGVFDIQTVFISALANAVSISNAQASELGVYQRPGSSRVNGILSGATSDVEGSASVDLDSLTGGAPSTAADFFGPVSCGTRSFSGVADFAGDLVDDNGDPVNNGYALARAEDDSDDVVPVRLYKQVIGGIDAMVTRTLIPAGETATATITVLDQKGHAVAGARVRRAGGSSLPQLANSRGQATFPGLLGSGAGTTYTYYVDANDDGAYQPGSEFARTVTITSY